MLFRITGLVACGLLVAAGCSGEAAVDGFGGASAGGNGSGGTATGGTTTTTTTTSSGQAGSGGSMTTKCGASLPSCESDEYCDLPDGANCAGEGTCEPRPEGCTEDCPGVCGCDKQFYCNGCMANAAGVEVSDNTSCTEQASYGAHALPGGLDRIIIKKQNDTDGRCIWLRAASPITGQLGVTIPNPWGVEGIAAFASTSGCMSTSQPPSSPPTHAASASGTISWTLEPNKIYPCELDIDVTVAFDNPPPWLAPTVNMVASGVKVDGCY